MAKVKKDILYSGNWRLPDGSTYTVGKSDLAHFAKRFTDMSQAGLHIPLAWAHQQKAKPMTDVEADQLRAEKVKLALGFADSIKVSDEGFLETVGDIPSDDDAKKIPAVRFVSPGIEWDFVDGTGRKWDGPSIMHVAFTQRPVQIPQQAAVMLSHSNRQVFLALSQYEGSDVDDDKKTDDETPDGVTSEEEKPPEAVEIPNLAEKIKLAIEALRKKGMILGDDTTIENLLDRLIVAAETQAATENPESLDDGEEVEEVTPTSVMMSQADITNAVTRVVTEILAKNGTHPPAQGLAKYTAPVNLAQSEKRIKALEGALISNHRTGLHARIVALSQSGRITPVIFADLEKRVKTVSLSLSSTGELQGDSLVIEVAAYEKLPAAAISLDDEGNVREVALSHENGQANGQHDRTAIDAMVAETLARINIGR